MTIFKHSLIQFLVFSVLMITLFEGNAVAATYTVSSPDASIVATINETPTFQYSVTKDGKTAITTTPLGITFNTMNLSTGLTFVSQTTRSVDSSYNPVVSIKNPHINRFNELTLNLKNAANNTFALVFRAYNEGVAFRYVPQGTGNANATSEASSFTLPTGTVFWAGASSGDYQGLWSYHSGSFNGTVQVPMLARTTDSIYVLVGEAGVYGTFTGSDLNVSGLKITMSYQSNPTCALPLTTMPWRYALVGNLANVIENGKMIVDNLNPANEITDVSWIKPGRVAWSWLTQGVSNLTQQKAYVDFAKSMGWEYILVDAGWRSTSPDQLIPYAATQGIGVILWFDYSEVSTASTFNSTMSQCIAYGPAFKGLKVDYVFSWDQAHMQWYDAITQAAVANKLLIYFHGCTAPRGQERRWPNYMTAEGIYGSEQDMSTPQVPLVHKCIIPYTRNVQPMDYTPTLFSKVTTSTYAMELAESMVYYSSLQHLCDNPTGYNTFTPSVVSFLKAVPTTWDDVKFLAGDPGNYLCIARRKGNDWFIGGINNATRTVNLDLSFLKAGSYSVSLYSDVSATARTMQVTTTTLTAPGTKSIMMANGGGFCCIVPNSYAATGIEANPGQTSKIPKEDRGISVVKTAIGYSIHVKGLTGYKVQVLNLSGQTVARMDESVCGTYSLDASSLRPGVYTVRVAPSAGGTTLVKRFVYR
jgi:hypothetical protein